MKIKIGPYIRWFGCYQLADLMLFWRDKRTDRSVNHFGEWLATNSKGEMSRLQRFFEWVHSKRSRTLKVKIDSYDVWSMDSTLAIIILPMLRNFKATTLGYKFLAPDEVDDPQFAALSEEARWNWVVDEMIWAFTQIQPDYDWEEQYYLPKVLAPNDSVDAILFSSVDFDHVGLKAHQKRMDRGFKFFGQYFQALWN